MHAAFVGFYFHVSYVTSNQILLVELVATYIVPISVAVYGGQLLPNTTMVIPNLDI